MAYEPSNLSGADNYWQQAMANFAQNAQNAQTYSPAAYQQSYNQANAINYDPYQQAANQMGQQYGDLANLSGQQMGQFAQQAQQAQGMQNQLYGGAGQIMQTAFDPQQALYGRTQQQVGDQINAGQAQRGLGNSAVGAAEYGQGMSNFNIDWQNQQLARQAQGMQAMSQASNAGVNQAGVVDTSLQNQMAAGQNQASMTGQAAQVPLTAQQTIAGMPAQNANQYVQNLSNLNALPSGQMNQAIPYMKEGIQANQFNAKAQGSQNAALANLGMQAAGSLLPYAKSGIQGLAGLFGGSGVTPTSGTDSAGIMSDYGNWMTGGDTSQISGDFSQITELSPEAALYSIENANSMADMGSWADTFQAADSMTSWIDQLFSW